MKKPNYLLYAVLLTVVFLLEQIAVPPLADFYTKMIGHEFFPPSLGITLFFFSCGQLALIIYFYIKHFQK